VREERERQELEPCLAAAGGLFHCSAAARRLRVLGRELLDNWNLLDDGPIAAWLLGGELLGLSVRSSTAWRTTLGGEFSDEMAPASPASWVKDASRR
jgi:hypothetical protein